MDTTNTNERSLKTGASSFFCLPFHLAEFLCLAIGICLLCVLGGCKKPRETKTTGSIGPAIIPERIISLSPAGSEILCALGVFDHIVARTDFCNYPPEIKNKPSVGGFESKSISIETIISFEPQLVYGTAGIHDFLAPQLEQLGISVYLSRAHSVKSLLDEFVYLSKLVTGSEQNGLALAQSVQSTFTLIQHAAANAEPLRVYYEVWGSPFMSVGSRSYINDIIQAAGGVNIFGDLDDEYPMVSEETIVAQNPQVIIVPDMNGETKAGIAARTGWQRIQAVQDGRIYFINADIFSRPGPRISEALSNIFELLHPELAGE
ncbi:MAG: cobalamin-binding protein [Treponema sp.]|nr:cobalamin-binding protein [Treponema sp.]